MAKNRKYANRGAKRSRFGRRRAFERNFRFKKYGARGRWRSTGYNMSDPMRFQPARHHGFKKRRRRSGGFGGAGDASYVTLSALGRRRRFLSAVQKALASKTCHEIVSAARHEGLTNRQGISWIPMCMSDQLRAAFYTSTGTTPNEGGRVYIEYIVCRMQIVNQTNVPVSIWLYELVTRRDISGPAELNDLWNDGIVAQGGTTGDYLLPFSTPFKSNRFCAQWLIRRVTKVLLAPGETHVHTVRVNVYSYVGQSRIYDSTGSTASGSTGVGGLSHVVGVVTLGGVVNSEGDDTVVGYAPHALDLAWTTSFRVAALYDDKHKYSKTSALTSFNDPKTMVEVDADPADVIEI